MRLTRPPHFHKPYCRSDDLFPSTHKGTDIIEWWDQDHWNANMLVGFSVPVLYKGRDIAEILTWFFLYGSSFSIFPNMQRCFWEIKEGANWQDLWKMGRKTKIKGFWVWGFSLLPDTIKEVCTTLMLLYLTKTERKEKEKSFLCEEKQWFLPSLFFSKWRLLKNVY